MIRIVMARKTISVDKKKGSVKFPEFDSDEALVYDLFDSIAGDKYQETYEAMLHIGALAMMEDRIAHLIESTEKQIFPQLERFKLHFERRKTQFEDTAQQKGDIAEDDIVDILKGANMVFITAGMGGGTGTGAAHVIARAAKELNILTVGVVTLPFLYEAPSRMRRAHEGLEELRKHVDTLSLIHI